MADNSTRTVRLSDRVAEEIRVLLVRRRRSASDLARQIGMTQPYLSRRLTGEVALDLDDLQRIADALEVDVRDLMPSRGDGQVTARSPVAHPIGHPVPVRSAALELTAAAPGRPSGPRTARPMWRHA